MNRKELVCYESDASRMAGRVERVYFPETIKEICEIVKKSEFDIVPRGAGTGLVGGAVPNNSIIIDLGNMDKVANFIPGRKTIHVEAGITLKELNEKLFPVGFEFPIDPTNKGISTIGGMIATNCNGARSMRYGTIKEWIEEIEFVNGRGELMKTSKADLADVCGMEGITGVIVGATLKLAPIFNRSASAFQSDNIDEVLNVIRKIKADKEIVIVDLLSPIVSKFLGLPEKYNLIVEFNSDRGKIKGKDYLDLVGLRENANVEIYKQGYYNSEDPKFFFDKLKDFILFLDERQIPYIGHPGFGIIMPYFKDNEKNKRQEVVEFVKKLKGVPGKYGYGLTRKHYLDSFQAKLIQRVKKRHDPFYKFNNGKVLDIDGKEDYIEDEIDYQVSPKEVKKEIIEYKEENKSENEIVVKISEKEIFETKIETNVDVIKDTKKINEEETIPEETVKDYETKDGVNLTTDLENHFEDNIINNQTKNQEMDKKEEEMIEKIKDPETKEILKEYESTFKSELNGEKMHEVEKIAKNIPRDIVKKEIHMESLPKKEKSNVDYNLIRNIMTNKSTGNPSVVKKDDKKEIQIDINRTFDNRESPKTSVRENLTGKSELTDKDKELINRILGKSNNYDKDKEVKLD